MVDLLHASSWVHEYPSWVFAIVLAVAMALASEVGYRIARTRKAAVGDAGRGHFNAIQASLLALLALLLGFTLSMSNQLAQARNQLVLDDAIQVEALHLGSGYLPEPRRAEFSRLLREYVGLRADPAAIRRSLTREELSARARQSVILHQQMWDLVKGEMQTEKPARGVEGLVPQLTQAQGIFRRRVHAFQSRVSDSIILLLFSAAIAAGGVVGYSGGLGQHRATMQSMLLAIFVSGTIYVILDLDHPLSGFIRVDQTPMLQIKATLDREAEPLK
jgi:hypothetical protein